MVTFRGCGTRSRPNRSVLAQPLVWERCRARRSRRLGPLGPLRRPMPRWACQQIACDLAAARDARRSASRTFRSCAKPWLLRRILTTRLPARSSYATYRLSTYRLSSTPGGRPSRLLTSGCTYVAEVARTAAGATAVPVKAPNIATAVHARETPPVALLPQDVRHASEPQAQRWSAPTHRDTHALTAPTKARSGLGQSDPEPAAERVTRVVAKAHRQAPCWNRTTRPRERVQRVSKYSDPRIRVRQFHAPT